MTPDELMLLAGKVGDLVSLLTNTAASLDEYKQVLLNASRAFVDAEAKADAEPGTGSD